MSVKYQIRYAAHPNDVKSYDTSKLRDEFLFENYWPQSAGQTNDKT